MKKIILALVLAASTVSMANAGTTITIMGDFTYINSGSATIVCSNMGSTTYCN